MEFFHWGRDWEAMKIRFFYLGNFSKSVRLGLLIFGAMLIYFPTEYVKSPIVWGILFLLGITLMAFGGFASWANTIGLKPFDNSYKKARKTYETDDEEGKPKS
jgi:fatty-acid desaturase